MIWNTIPNDERLHLWKTLREEIKGKSLDQQLTQVAKFCASIPFGSRTLDYYSTDEWPTPWEILYHGSFCTSSISLLMYYTLVLLPLSERVDLQLVEDDTGIFLLPVINDQFALNYELSQVSNYSEISNNFKVLQTFNKDQIKTIT